MDTTPLQPTREALHRLATHLLARAQEPHLGRISLHATPGGFATSRFGQAGERLRISGGLLVRETDTPSGTAVMPIDGASLAELAAFAGVQLTVEYSVGPDTQPLGDAATPIGIDHDAVVEIADWYALTARALDELGPLLPPVSAEHRPSLAQLWPEHFDLAIDAAFDASDPARRRVNVGGTPGDGFHDEPYLYVGPWTADRPGDGDFWNAPFGAVVASSRIMTADDPVAAAVAFFRTGLDHLTGAPR